MVQKGGSFDPYDPPLDPPLLMINSQHLQISIAHLATIHGPLNLH